MLISQTHQNVCPVEKHTGDTTQVLEGYQTINITIPAGLVCMSKPLGYQNTPKNGH